MGYGRNVISTRAAWHVGATSATTVLAKRVVRAIGREPVPSESDARREGSAIWQLALCVLGAFCVCLALGAPARASDEVLFADAGDDGPSVNNLWLADGGSPSLIPVSVRGAFSLAPNDDRIAFFKHDNGLYITDTSGSTPQLLYGDPWASGFEFANDQDRPSWAPDGRSIAIAEPDDFTGEWDIAEVHMSASWPAAGDVDTEPVITLPGNQTNPIISPDGRKIVFESDTAPNGTPLSMRGLYIANRDGSNPVELVDENDWGWYSQTASFSPSGEKVLYRGGNGNWRLTTVDVTTGQIEAVSETPLSYEEWDPYWSADGSIVYLTIVPPNFEYYRVMRVDPDTLVTLDVATLHTEQDWPRVVGRAPDGSGSDHPHLSDDETLGDNNPSEHQCVCSAGDPVNTATGNYYEQLRDVTASARGVDLNLERTYNSQDVDAPSPYGPGWTDNWHASLSQEADIVTIRQENGSVVRFTDHGDGTFTAPERVLGSLTYSAGTWTLTRRQREILKFNADGQLVRREDLNGDGVTLTYDGSDRLAAVTDEADRSLTFSYDGAGRIDEVTDPADHTVTYGYDGDGDLVTFTDARGKVWEYTYDGDHQMLTRVDPLSNTVMANVYDGQDRVISQTDAVDREISFDYDGDQTRVTQPNGRVDVYTYTNGALASVTRGSGTSDRRTTRYTYDPDSFALVKTTEPGTRVTRRTYDAAGNETSITTPDGETTERTYDGLGNLLSTTTPDGTTTTATYDGSGNILTRTQPTGPPGDPVDAVTQYSYDNEDHPGDLTEIEDPDGRTVTMTYDTTGNLATRSDELGNETSFSYDANGLKLTKVSPRGNADGATPLDHTTTREYNSLGQVTSTTSPMGKETTQTYDDAGRLHTVTDPAGGVTTYSYDDAGRTTAVERPDERVEMTSYDDADNVVSRTNANDQATTYEYDVHGHRTAIVDARDRRTEYEYDAAGDLVKRIKPNGAQTTYSYDQAGHLTAVDHEDDNTADISYSYDVMGRKIEMTDGTGTSSYGYDIAGRLLSMTSGSGKTVSYGYDLAGNVTNITYPNGETLDRQFDQAGRLDSITDWNGNETTFEYDADGHLTETHYPDGTDNVDSVAYDRDGAPSGVAFEHDGNPLGSIDYDRNLRNELTASDQTGLPGPDETYGHDELGRLTSVNSDDFTYDDADQPLAFEGKTGASYSDAGELTGLETPAGQATYRYDSAGNRITSHTAGQPRVRYAYNEDDKLTRVTAGQPMISSAGGHTLAAQANGQAMAWGRNDRGQLGDDTTTATSTPQNVKGLDDVKAVAAGERFSLGLTDDGTVKAWGAGTQGQLGDGEPAFATTSVLDDANRSDASSLGSGWTTPTGTSEPRIASNEIAAASDGSLSQAFRDTPAAPDSEVFTTIAAKDPADTAKLYLRADPDAGDGYVITIVDDSIIVSREDDSSETELTSAYQPVAENDSVGARIVGDRITVYHKQSGGAWTKVAHAADSTYPAAGKIGFSIDTTTTRLDDFGGGDATAGTPADVEHPQTVPGITGTVTAIAAGDNFGLALDSDGQVWAWGDNSHGQLGDGSTTGHAPELIDALGGIVAIAAGANHSMALDANGDVYTWGNNTDNQLGPDRSDSSVHPTIVPDLSGATAIAAGADFSLALTDGDVVAWGANDHHQLGDAAAPSTPGEPVTAYDIQIVKTITAHGQTAIATSSDGDVVAWGANNDGQLADGTTTDATPNDVPALAEHRHLALGDGAGFAIGPNGTAKSWGAGNHGQLGTGDTDDQTTPAAISGYGGAFSDSWTYSYDGDGLRTAKTNGTTTTTFSWDRISGSLPVMLDISGTSIIYGPNDLPIAQIADGDETLYYHHDQLGSTRRVTDADGDTQAAYTYSAYGTLTASMGATKIPFGFAGQYTDAETGLQYLRARYYDPATAQFITRDPLEEESGSPYGYAGSDPVDYTDPSGLILGIPGTPSFEEIADFSAGFGDNVTFGLTGTIRGELGIDNVDYCSDAYGAGGTGGLALSMALPIPGPGKLKGLAQLAPKIGKQMGQRGWTEEAIQEAITSGKRVAAINKATGNPATRYIHPKTGQSVVVDNVTKEVIHVGGPGFRYGPESGDVR